MPELQVIQKSDEQRYTLGVVYAPGEVDAHGDYTTADEIQNACFGFMKQLQGRSEFTKAAEDLLAKSVQALAKGEEVQIDITPIYDDITKGATGDQHSNFDSEAIGDIVECYLAPVDFAIGDEQIKKGTWLMGHIWTPEQFQKIKDGDRTGLSMGGYSFKVPTEGVE